MRRYSGFICVSALIVFVLLASLPVRGEYGQEAGPGIVAEQMEGRRLPDGLECDWHTGSLVIGLGERAQFRVRWAEDVDIYYDPYNIWDRVVARWEFYDSQGQRYWPHDVEPYCEEHTEPGGRVYYDFYVKVTLEDKGGYTVKCFIDDEWPANTRPDDAEICRSMGADVQFSVSILQVFSTDGSTIDAGSPLGGTVGMEIEWVAGFRPGLASIHECDWRPTPQHQGPWVTMEEHITCDFPNRGKYYWNSTPEICGDDLFPCRDNGDWKHRAELDFNGWHESDERDFTLQNLTIEDTSPPYLKYDPDAESPDSTIHYRLRDAFNVCAVAQETAVTVEIFQSDGVPVKSETVMRTAGRSGLDYYYVWNGKHAQGELMPKGIYTYRITATQDLNRPWNHQLPPPPTAHYDTDCDKSSWVIAPTEAEVTAYDEQTGISTVSVSFEAGPTVDYPADLMLGSASVDVYDPDLVLVDHASLDGPLSVYRKMTFPDVHARFEKTGKYVFLVSVWDSMYINYLQVKPHRVRPLRQTNVAIDIYHDQYRVYLDPGHHYAPGTDAHTGTSGTPSRFIWSQNCHNLTSFRHQEAGVACAACEPHVALEIASGYYFAACRGEAATRTLRGLLRGPVHYWQTDTRHLATWTYEVYRSRIDENGPSLEDRYEYVNEFNRNNPLEPILAYISLHCDGNAGSKDGSFAEYCSQNRGGQLLATKIFNGYWGWDWSPDVATPWPAKNISQYSPITNIRSPGIFEDESLAGRHQFMRHLRTPAALIEMVTLTNAAEESLMCTPEIWPLNSAFRSDVAYSLHMGIDKYFYERYLQGRFFPYSP